MINTIVLHPNIFKFAGLSEMIKVQKLKILKFSLNFVFR